MNNLTPAVPSRIVQLVASFSHPEPIRRGSLYERRMKCGQEGCACQHDPKAAHGPYFTLTQRSTARRILAISLPNRRLWSGGRSNRDGNFENASKPIGKPVSDGPMNNSTLRRPKKGALHGPGKRDLPGNRSALRPSGGGRTGF